MISTAKKGPLAKRKVLVQGGGPAGPQWARRSASTVQALDLLLSRESLNGAQTERERPPMDSSANEESIGGVMRSVGVLLKDSKGGNLPGVSATINGPLAHCAVPVPGRDGSRRARTVSVSSWRGEGEVRTHQISHANR